MADASVDRRAFIVSLAGIAALPSRASAQAAGLAHPKLQEALQFLKRRQWDRLSKTVAAEPPQSALILIDELGDASEIDSNIDGLSRHEGGETISGGLLVGWAWRYRGTGFSSTVTPVAATKFYERLQLAHAHLTAAQTADADNGVAASLHIRAQMGLGDLPGVESAFKALERASRQPIGGYGAYAVAICGKWHGSQERMLGFARQRRAKLPPSSFALIPQAHIETLFSFSWTPDLSAALRAPTYLTEEAVHKEIVAANEAFHAAKPDADPFVNRFAHAHFSFAFVAMDEFELARPHVIAMGRYISGPWNNLENPREAIDATRQALGLSDL